MGLLKYEFKVISLILSSLLFVKVVIARQLAVNTEQYLRDLWSVPNLEPHLRPPPESEQSLSGRRLGRLGPRWTADWAASELDSLLILFCLSKALIVVKTLRRYYLGEREVGESIIDNKRENYGYWEEQDVYCSFKYQKTKSYETRTAKFLTLRKHK